MSEQLQSHETENFASINNMKINKKKTKIIKFTNARSLDFPPELTFVDGSSLDTMTETCLLGVVISHDLKWAKNTAYICNKARRKLWILRRMQFLDLTKQELFYVYQKEVRSIMEYAVPVWHSSLTRKQVSEIESVQKIAFKMILGQSYSGYTDACATLNTETLEKRRLDICLRFAKKNVQSGNSLFTKPNIQHNLRSRNRLVQEYRCNKVRFERSSLPFLSKLLNQNS